MRTFWRQCLVEEIAEGADTEPEEVEVTDPPADDVGVTVEEDGDEIVEEEEGEDYLAVMVRETAAKKRRNKLVLGAAVVGLVGFWAVSGFLGGEPVVESTAEESEGTDIIAVHTPVAATDAVAETEVPAVSPDAAPAA